MHDENIRITWPFLFLTGDLVSLNNNCSISHSPRPLAAGPIRISEDMESVLPTSRLQLVGYKAKNGTEVVVKGHFGSELGRILNHWLENFDLKWPKCKRKLHDLDGCSISIRLKR